MVIELKQVDPGEPSLESLRAFDADAWVALHDAHHERLWRYAYARTGSRDLAEDVVAQTFAEAVASIQRYRPMGKPIIAWLYIITRNHASKAVREARRHSAMPAELATNPNRDQVELIALAEVLRRLPKRQREVLLLRYFVGASTEEIGRFLGKTPTAVYSLHARAIEAIRRELEPANDENQRSATKPAVAGYRHVR